MRVEKEQLQDSDCYVETCTYNLRAQGFKPAELPLVWGESGLLSSKFTASLVYKVRTFLKLKQTKTQVEETNKKILKW